MAGALGLQLAGPRVYGDDAGRRRLHGRRAAREADAGRHPRAALRLYRRRLRALADAVGDRRLLRRAHRAQAEQRVEIDMRARDARRARRASPRPSLRRRASRPRAERREPGGALAVVGEQPVDIGAGHAPVGRDRAVGAPVGEAQQRPRRSPARRAADMHLVARNGAPLATQTPVDSRSVLSPGSTVSTSSRPSPATSPGGPSMPSGSATRAAEHLVAAADAEHAAAAPRHAR